MNPKSYEKLTHVNYGGSTCALTPLTVATDFAEFESVLARLHQFFLHDWGVGSGCQVAGAVGSAALEVQAGVVIDRKGNLIVLSTGGSGLLGDPDPAATGPFTEVPVPVTVPTTGLAAQKYLLTIQWKETHRSIASPPDFFCGTQEQTPLLALQPVPTYVDKDDYVVLAVVEVDANSKVKSVNAIDPTVPLSRRRLGITVGSLNLETPFDGSPAGTVLDAPVGVIAPLPAGIGLQIAAFLTVFPGNVGIGQTTASRPLDVVGSAAVLGAAGGPELVVLSSTPGGGGGVETRDASGKRMAVLTTTGTGATQAGYIGVNTAAGTEVVSLSASSSGAGQVQVQTRTGKAAVVLNTAGPADDGFVHLFSNAQEVVTLGPTGISSKGPISTQGAIAAQGGISAQGPINTPAAGSFDGGVVARAGVFTSGNVQSSAAVIASGNVQSGAAVIAAGNVQAGAAISAQGQISTPAAGFFDGGVVAKGGLFTSGNVQSSAAVIATGVVQSGSAVIAAGNVQAGGAVIAQGSINAKGQVITPAAGFFDGGVVAKAGVFTTTVVQAATLNISGAKHFIMPHPKDASKDIVYACIEGPEAAAYIRGRATLKSGRAQVELPEHFAFVVNPDTMTVQLTPRSAGSKGLAVIDSSPNGFEVKELFDGTGSYDFDYFVSAVRKGYENYQPVVAKGFSPLGDQFFAPELAATPASASVLPSLQTPDSTAAPVALPTPPIPTPEPGGKPSPWNVL